MPLSEKPSKALAPKRAIHMAVHVNASDAVRTCRACTTHTLQHAMKTEAGAPYCIFISA